MNSVEGLKKIINNRICAICLQGKSIEELETSIDAFKEYDICWTSLGVFDIIQENILNKINKKIEIVLDCATVPHSRVPHYEKHVRVPRLETFLKQGGLWMTSYGLIRDSLALYYPHFLLHYDNQILLVDKVFPQDNVPYWMNVPNSITLFIGALMAGGAKEIMIFGLDGYANDPMKGVDSYYQPEVIAKERLSALGSTIDQGINRDSLSFDERFAPRFEEYKKIFGDCKIWNCSPISMFKSISKLDYSDCLGLLNERTVRK